MVLDTKYAVIKHGRRQQLVVCSSKQCVTLGESLRKKSHKCVLTIPVLAAAAAFLARQLLKLPHNIPAVCAKPLQANAHL